MSARNGRQATKAKPILGITMGDPAGIGPEVIAKALSMPAVHRLCRPIVIGSLPVMEQIVQWLRLPLKVIQVSEYDVPPQRSGSLLIFDPLERSLGKFPLGAVSEKAGAASVAFILKAVHLAQIGCLDAVVTGPINKEAINLAGGLLSRSYRTVGRHHEEQRGRDDDRRRTFGKLCLSPPMSRSGSFPTVYRPTGFCDLSVSLTGP